MKISHIKTKGFRKHQDTFETDLFDITEITGGNRKGKSNILYAIIWAFLGSNLTGDDKTSLINNNSIDCYVSIEFLDNNGTEHIIERYKNSENSKKNYLLLDNLKAEQHMIYTYTGNKKLFLSVMNPNYFINKKPAEQKELLDQYLPYISIESVFNLLPIAEQETFEGIPKNIGAYITELNDNKKMYENKIKNIRGQIEYAENIVSTPISEKQIFEETEKLEKYKEKLTNLLTNSNTNQKNTMTNNIKLLEEQISKTQKNTYDIDTKMQKGKQEYNTLKQSNKGTCPTCKQEIQNTQKLLILNKMKEDLTNIFNDFNLVSNDLAKLKQDFIIEKSKYLALQKSSNELEITDIKVKIYELENKQKEILKYNTSIDTVIQNITNAKADIRNFKTDILKYETLLENIKYSKEIAKKLYINYIETRMKPATNYLNKVKIKYETVIKDTGEIKDDFIITYEDKIQKDWSKSETMAVSLELANMFNKISNINLPLFIDDNESSVDFNFKEIYANENQLLISEVVKGQDLQITNISKNTNIEMKVA